MKFLHEQLKLKTVSNRPSYNNITSDVKKIFEKSRKMLLTFGPVFAIIIHAP